MGIEITWLLFGAATFLLAFSLAFLCAKLIFSCIDNDLKRSELERGKYCGSKEKRGSSCIATTSSLAAGEGFEQAKISDKTVAAQWVIYCC